MESLEGDTLRERLDGLMQLQDDEVVINVKGLLYGLCRKWWLIIIVSILGAAIGYVTVNQTVVNSYSVSIAMSVTSKPSEDRQLSISDITAADRLIPNYMELVRNNQVLEKIALASNTSYDRTAIGSMITTNTIENTNILNVIVKGNTEEEVKSVADAVAQAMPESLVEMLPVGNIKIIDRSQLMSSTYANSPIRNTIIGGMLGIVLVSIIICTLELVKNPIRDEKDLERVFGVVLLGSVPKFKVSKKNKKKLKRKKVNEKNSDNIVVQVSNQNIVM